MEQLENLVRDKLNKYSKEELINQLYKKMTVVEKIALAENLQEKYDKLRAKYYAIPKIPSTKEEREFLEDELTELWNKLQEVN